MDFLEHILGYVMIAKLGGVDLLAAQIFSDARIFCREVQPAPKKLAQCRVKLMVWLNTPLGECAHANACGKHAVWR